MGVTPAGGRIEVTRLAVSSPGTHRAHARRTTHHRRLDPVSAVTTASRQLLGNPNPSATIHTWPMQHPVLASLLWSVALIAIFAPLATTLYRRRTTD